MDLERAKEIVHAVNSVAYATIGVPNFLSPQWLEKVPLAEMIEAKALVENDNKGRPSNSDGSKSFSIIPDDRLIAAVYVLLHYDAGRAPILTDSRLDRALGMLRFSDLPREEEEWDL